jgi:hypothetical protein
VDPWQVHQESLASMACLANPTAGSVPCATLITYCDDLRRALIGPIEDCIRERVKTGQRLEKIDRLVSAQHRLRESSRYAIRPGSAAFRQGEHNPGNEVSGAPEQRRPVDGSNKAPSPPRAMIVTAKPRHAGDAAIAQRIRGNSAPITLKPDGSIAFKSDSKNTL